MTTLIPGVIPPQVAMAALVSSGLKYKCLRGPALSHLLIWFIESAGENSADAILEYCILVRKGFGENFEN